MNFQINEQAAKVLAKQKKHRLYVALVAIAAVITVVGVIFALTRPGRAFSSLEKTLNCQVSVHEHTEECFDANGNLICKIADYVAHTHDPETCYDDNGELVCTLEEIVPHVHTDECYMERLVLICELEEGELVEDEDAVNVSGNEAASEIAEPLMQESTVPVVIMIPHTHTEECFVNGTELVCADPEHEHTDECYADVTTLVCQIEEGTEVETITYETVMVPVENEAAAVADASQDKKLKEHVHSEKCYEVVQQLVCNEQTLHVHDAECLDEDGQLSCGILQLAEHVHGDDCYIFDEKKVTVEAVVSNYKITATYGASAKIPSKAEFRASIITPETDATLYETSEAAINEAVGEEVNSEEGVLFDIGFYVNGEEVEPKGPVEISFSIIGGEEELTTGDEVTVIHIEESGNVDVKNSEVNDDGEAVISTESFSVYKLILNNGTTNNNYPLDKLKGKHGNYYIDVNETKDSFSSGYEMYKDLDGVPGPDYNEFGNAAYFHIIAFNEADLVGSHVNGNVLAKKAVINSAFYTKNLPYELSYVQELTLNTELTASTNDEGKLFVMGANNQLVLTGNSNNGEIGDEIQLGNNRKKVNSPNHLLIDRSTNTPFVDLGALRSEMVSLSGSLGDNPDSSVKVYGDCLMLEDPEVAGYINVTADFVNANWGNRVFHMKGFESGKNGTIIINVDCKNQKNIQLPSESDIYINGVPQGTGEVTTYETGKVVWNFINCEGASINTYRMCGIILAPGAHVTSNGNLNGQIIADKVVCNGESHRVSFTGTTIPVKASLNFGKTVAGATPTESQKFTFSVKEYVNGTWVLKETAVNNGKNIVFNGLDANGNNYLKFNSAATHYFLVSETADSAQDNRKYIYDAESFLLKVDVVLEGIRYKATTTRYEVSNSDIDKIFTAGANVLNTNVLNQKANNDELLTFDNTPNFTEVSVEKQWLDYMDQPLNAQNTPDLPEISVKLYQTTDANKSVNELTDADLYESNANIVLTKDNSWKYTWKELPIKSATNEKYYYYINETPVEGYELVEMSNQTWFEGNTTQILINKKLYIPKYTKVTVEKIFKLPNGDVISNPNITKDGEKVSFRLLQFDASDANDAGHPYVGKVLYNGQQIDANADTIFEIDLAKDASKWSTALENLPLKKFENGVITEYRYSVVETNCSVAEFNRQLGEPEVKVTYFDEDGNQLADDADKTDANAVFDCTLVNTTVDTELAIEKNWFTVSGDVAESIQNDEKSEESIRVTLYQIKGDISEEMGSYIIKATEASAEAGAKIDIVSNIDANAKKYWAAKFINLPKYYVEDGELKTYKYSVVEDTSSLVDFELVVDDTETNAPFRSNLTSVAGEDGKYSTLVLVNQSTVKFVLPETGSTGRNAIYIVGSALMLCAAAIFVYRKKLHR